MLTTVPPTGGWSGWSLEFLCLMSSTFPHWCLHVSSLVPSCVQVGSSVSLVAWSGWSLWSSCSRSCGGGSQVRRRSCITNAPDCAALSRPTSDDDVSASLQNRSCNTQACPGMTYSTLCTTTKNSVPNCDVLFLVKTEILLQSTLSSCDV